MFEILSYLPRKHKQTISGWYAFDAVCCQHNGQSKDTRGRGGIKFTETGWVYHCFNCGFKTSYTVGRPLSLKLREFLSWLNVDNYDIEVLNFESLRHRSLLDLIPKKFERRSFSFDKKSLPKTAELITDDPKFELYTNYLKDRGLSLTDYPFMVDTANSRPGILIPYTYRNQNVGHTIRFLDGQRPKYKSDQPLGFVFGIDLQKKNWSFAIAVEGVIDAISISGVGLLHNDISIEQAQVLQSLNKEIVVVPDQDLPGLELVDRAVELGFSVSIPDWSDCKDINDAVKKYGKLTTLLSIIQSKETSRIKIELMKKRIARRLK